MFSISSIASAIAAIGGTISTAESVAKNLGTVYQFTGHLMQAAEAFGSQVAGDVKKEAVVSQVKALATTLGHTWTDIEGDVVDFIDAVKGAYNTAQSSLSTMGATAAASGPNATGAAATAAP